MTENELIEQYEERARNEREVGAEIEIDTGLPYISIKMSDDSEYAFQEHEAENLLNDVPDWINAEDYLLAIAQNW